MIVSRTLVSTFIFFVQGIDAPDEPLAGVRLLRETRESHSTFSIGVARFWLVARTLNSVWVDRDRCVTFTLLSLFYNNVHIFVANVTIRDTADAKCYEISDLALNVLGFFYGPDPVYYLLGVRDISEATSGTFPGGFSPQSTRVDGIYYRASTHFRQKKIS